MNCLHTHNFLCALCFSSTDHWFFKTTSALSVLYSVHNGYITNCLVTKVNMIIISRKVQLFPVSSRSQAQEDWPTSKQIRSPQLSFTLTFTHLLHCLYPAGPSFTFLASRLPHPMVKSADLLLYLIPLPSLYSPVHGLCSSKHCICSHRLFRTFLISYIPGTNSSPRSQILYKQPS